MRGVPEKGSNPPSITAEDGRVAMGRPTPGVAGEVRPVVAVSRGSRKRDALQPLKEWQKTGAEADTSDPTGASADHPRTDRRVTV